MSEKIGILVGMADGSVRHVSKTIDPEIWFHGLNPEYGVKDLLD